MDKNKRLQAMHELDAILQDEAFYVPFWQAPFMRFLYWDYVSFPSFYFPKRIQQMTDWQVFWIDEDKRRALADAMADGRALGRNTVIDVDPYEVKDRLEAAMKAAGDG